MNIEGSVAFVTGANRGLGKALTDALLARGARVYAGARDISSIDDPRVTAVEVDITDPASVAAAAARCGDVDIVINNAGIATGTSPLGPDGVDGARRELEVNYFGPMSVARSFAPVLAANGGGALVNVLSVLSWIAFPESGNYCASKSAAWSMTNSLRVLLRDQGTVVTGVHVGYIDTDMVASVEAQKNDPADVATAILDGIAAGTEEVLVDDIARQVKAALSLDVSALYPAPAATR